MKTIAVDIDDVLSSHSTVFLRYHNENYGTNLTIKDFQVPGEYKNYYGQVMGVGEEEGQRRFQKFLDKKVSLKQMVIPKATVKILEDLKRRFRLEIITARGEDYQKGTEAWLEKHIPNIFDGVHFVELWDREDRKATKALICQEIGAGYLIDDSVEHCTLAHEAGVQALLFGEYGWNMTQAIPESVVRVKDWQAVKEYFDGRD